MIALEPKEKAKELVDKYNVDLRPFSEFGHWDIYHAKDCALICVDEMLDIRNSLYVNEGSLVQEYLLEVKKA